MNESFEKDLAVNHCLLKPNKFLDERKWRGLPKTTTTTKKKQKKKEEVNGHSGEIWKNAVDVNKASYRTLTWRFL